MLKRTLVSSVCAFGLVVACGHPYGSSDDATSGGASSSSGNVIGETDGGGKIVQLADGGIIIEAPGDSGTTTNPDAGGCTTTIQAAFTNVGGPPFTSTQFGGGTMTTVNSGVFQVQTTSGSAPPKTAFLVAALPAVPKSIDCKLDFAPDTAFTTTGEPIDIFVINYVASDQADSVAARISYYDGAFHVRAGGNDSASNARVTQGLFNTLEIKASGNRQTLLVGGATLGGIIAVPQDLARVELWVGLNDTGASPQVARFQHFHCDLGC